MNRHIARLILISKIAGNIAIIVGLLVLIGWMFHFDTLKSIHRDFVSMKANSALAFVLAGVSLNLLHDPNRNRRRQIGQILAVIVTLIGIMTLIEYLFHVDLRIDQILFQEEPGAVGTSSPDRMSPISAFNFALLGISLLILDWRIGRGQELSQYLVLIAGTSSFLALIGYAYGTSISEMEYTTMALHSSLAFIALCVGILLARPNATLVAIFSKDTAGGLLARRLLPVAILVPILFGWLRLEGQLHGLYNYEFGISLLTIFTVITLTILIFMGARELNRLDEDRLQALEAVRASEQLTRLIIDKAHEAYVGIDVKGVITGWNPSAEMIFGWSREEAIGKSVSELIIPPEYREAHYRGMSQFLQTGKGPVLNKLIELPALHKDGHRLPVELTISAISWNDSYQFNAFIRDITKRRQVEEKIRELSMDLQSRARQLQIANKELESFSYSVSHDLRAPLRAIDGFSRVLMEDHYDQLNSEAKRVLQIIRDNTKKMAVLIDNLLNFSRIGRREMKRTPIAMSELAQNVFRELKEESLERSIEFIGNDLPSAIGDHQMIRQVLINLFSNAIKFSRHQETARIEIGATVEGDEIIYYIKDNGVGFDMNYSNKLFGVFQRLHSMEEFEGTGVGLAIVQRVIQKHGGRVWAEASVNEGATFFFTLPTVRDHE